MKIKILTFSYFILITVSSNLFAQGLPTAAPESVGLSEQRLERIDNLIEKEISDSKIAGAVVLIARKGKTAYLKSFGYQDKEAEIKMDNNTMFRIASMTKPITSVAVMMLYEEGHFMLMDNVSAFIPEFKNPMVQVVGSNGQDSLVPAKREIRIRDLLTHTSGIPYQWNDVSGPRYKDVFISGGLAEFDRTTSENIKKLAQLPLVNHPGEKFTYGLSIDVLGYLVEVVSGISFDKFLQERIFKPLKMNDTYFYPPEEKLPKLAAAYTLNGDNKIERINDGRVLTSGAFEYTASYPYGGPKTYFSGGAGLVSTANDYVRFCQMILNNGELDGERILSRKTVELMSAVHIGPPRYKHFGLGFYINMRDIVREVGSRGTLSWSGFWYTTFFIDPTEELIGIYMSQLRPVGNSKIKKRFKTLVLQSIDD
ncbi:MAG: beta-lactamase family protein [Melioribacteraceae bacterium]|nr:beta-lactamase family protein [Melioribacteraceae bacterium]